MRRAGAGVQLGAPHRRRAVGRHLLQQVGADPERQEAGSHRPHPAEQAAAGPVPRGRGGAALRQAGRAHRGPLAGPRGPRHGVLLLPRQRRSSQEAPAAEWPPRRGRWHLRARVRAGVAGGGEDQGRRRGHGDRGQDRRGRAERQVLGQRDDGRVRGVGGLVAGEDGRRGAGGAAGQERGRRDRRGGGVRVPG